MSIDRRIVSILYYNNIIDIENVEKFIGEKDNYYEILMNGDILKLKIPGKEYTTDLVEKIETDKAKELKKVSKDAKKQNLKTENYEIEKEVIKDILPNETTFEDDLLKSENENKELEEAIKTTTKSKKSKKKENLDDELDDFINLI